MPKKEANKAGKGQRKREEGRPRRALPGCIAPLQLSKLAPSSQKARNTGRDDLKGDALRSDTVRRVDPPVVLGSNQPLNSERPAQSVIHPE